MLGFMALGDSKWAAGTSGIPQLVGAADGTHIPIEKPANTGDAYINRKGFFSMNVHAICDHTCRFIDVFIGYTGRCHDTTVFEASPLWDLLRSGWIGTLLSQCGAVINGVPVPIMFIADAAYTVSPFVLPAYKDGEAASNPKKALFNKKHCSTRNPIERAFGVLKNRWRCLLKKLELDLCNIHVITAACFALHNVCLDLNESEPDENDPVFVQMYAEYKQSYEFCSLYDYSKPRPLPRPLPPACAGGCMGCITCMPDAAGIRPAMVPPIS